MIARWFDKQRFAVFRNQGFHRSVQTWQDVNALAVDVAMVHCKGVLQQIAHTELRLAISVDVCFVRTGRIIK